jgi:hypothetical protein
MLHRLQPNKVSPRANPCGISITLPIEGDWTEGGMAASFSSSRSR